MEDIAPPSEQVMITGGASQALDMLCMLLTRPGDVALVQEPTYHLALRVMRDHQLNLTSVPSDDNGIQVEVLEKILQTFQRQGKQAKLFYLVSTFNNPSGISLGVERRKIITDLAQKYGLLVIEDDVYHQLWYDGPPPPSLFHKAPIGTTVRLGSFSKILAPGLRLGWMIAPPQIVEKCVKSGVLDSGGGLGHFNAHVVAAFIEAKYLDMHIAALRSNYRKRRDVLVHGLKKHLPDGCQWVTPEGGFFLWLRLPRGLKSSTFLKSAEAAGVSYLPGNLFYVNGDGASYCRLNFTMVSLEDLEEGAKRLGTAIRKINRIT
jgi:DNA-binding transcriptional MocR family regulator